MSNDYTPGMGEPDPIPGGPEIDLGTLSEGGHTTDEVADETPKSYLEIDDDIAQRYVRVKVDGEDVEVPVPELLKGYSRTADYTRKAQALAAERQEAEYAIAVQRALAANPQETLRLLAQQAGIDWSPPQSQAQQPQGQSPFSEFGDPDDDDPYVDPVERKLAQIERQQQVLFEREQQRAADMQLQASISGLRTKFPEVTESDIRQVIQTALTARMGPAQFEMIYKNMAFDREQQARQAAVQQRQTEEARREQAKMQGQQLVASGGSAASAGAPPPDASEGRMSIHQAFDAAWDEVVEGARS